MSLRKRGLGRGLEALLVDVKAKGDKPHPQTLPINKLQQGVQQSPDLMDADGLQELAYAIIAADTVEPIVVRKLPDGHFEIIEGENRWQAAQLAGLQEVPVFIEALAEREAIAVALIDALQQENLDLLQEAEALKTLLDEFEALVRRL